MTLGTVNRLQTLRGERGVNLKITEERLSEKITVPCHSHTHGDNRFLPNFYTASGFSIAIEINKAYIAIKRADSLNALLAFGLSAGLLPRDEYMIERPSLARCTSESPITDTKQRLLTNPRVIALIANYAKQLGFNGDSQLTDQQMSQVIAAMKQEFFLAVTREIIQSNKDKVDTYFDVLNRQAVLELLRLDNFNNCMKDYQASADESCRLPEKPSFGVIDRYLYLLLMIAKGPQAFLAIIIPKLINVDLTHVPSWELEKYRLLLLNHLLNKHQNYLQSIVDELPDKALAKTMIARLLSVQPKDGESLLDFITRHPREVFSLLQAVPVKQFSYLVDKMAGRLEKIIPRVEDEKARPPRPTEHKASTIPASTNPFSLFASQEQSPSIHRRHEKQRSSSKGPIQ